jgi:hypothetical protein
LLDKGSALGGRTSRLGHDQRLANASGLFEMGSVRRTPASGLLVRSVVREVGGRFGGVACRSGAGLWRWRRGGGARAWAFGRGGQAPGAGAGEGQGRLSQVN